MNSWDVDNDPLRNLSSTTNGILERVDEYSLYCHYLGYEPIPHSGRYRSPIRTDDDIPSFGIFYSEKNPDREFLWKDQATGQVGDIFRLVQLMHRYPTEEMAERRIAKDFGLSDTDVEVYDKLVYHKAPMRYDINITIASRSFTQKELDYWMGYNISQSLLSNYNVTAVKYLWLTDTQDKPSWGQEFTFAYRILDKYKIYRPFADKQYKFRNNFTAKHVEGLQQLQFNSPLLIITKSLKDVMFLRSIGLEAISPRSENTPMDKETLTLLEHRYKNIVTLFDNDGKHRADYYPHYPELHVPEELGEKDPTDVAMTHGIDVAEELIYTMMEEYL